MTDKRTILIAGMGTSPAVLTETVWALCHQKKPMVPDEIVVLVTKSGKERLCAELLTGEKSVWEKMLAALKKEKIKIDGKLIFGETSIRVIPDERGNGVWDLRSGEDNLRAADFMLRQIRQYTESSDTVVLASIAGGRKTMSALLFSCMSLLGREDDKVFHVLLPPEFEGGVEQPMYYPVKGVTYTNTHTGKKYKSDKYHSELFEVPFVRMRGWYQEKFKTIPPTYRTLISKVQTVAPPAVNYPEIEIDAANGTVKLNGSERSRRSITMRGVMVQISVVPKGKWQGFFQARMTMILCSQASTLRILRSLIMSRSSGRLSRFRKRRCGAVVLPRLFCCQIPGFHPPCRV